jgi:hypothetical protein
MLLQAAAVECDDVQVAVLTNRFEHDIKNDNIGSNMQFNIQF